MRVKDAWRFTFNTRMGLHKVSATTEEANPIKACLTCLPYLAAAGEDGGFHPASPWVTSVRKAMGNVCSMTFIPDDYLHKAS